MPKTVTEVEPTTANRGWGEMLCPKCNELAIVRVDLMDGKEFRCDECEDVFYHDDVRALCEQAVKWGRVLQWLETMPCEGGAE